MSDKRVLIYRLGSLGDTVIALPCFHLIARAFPNTERHLLCNMIDNIKASHSKAILHGTGLVHEYISYPPKLKDYRRLAKLRRKILELNPDLLIYLLEPRSKLKLLRDALFFRLCGIKKVIGIPWRKKLQNHLYIEGKNIYEPEAHRMARCLERLGSAQLENLGSWDLHLTDEEKNHVLGLLDTELGKGVPFITCSVGAKVEVKDWGIENWTKLIGRLNRNLKNHLALVFIGVKSEYSLGERVGRSWEGKKVNLCGRLTPRESAVVLGKAKLFIGHDSGPMHLAAAMGTPCVAIFSARNKPGVWFPYGENHTVIYHKTECYGCGLEVCDRHGKKCIKTITVDEVLEAVEEHLEGHTVRINQ